MQLPTPPRLKQAALAKLLSNTGNAHNIASIISNDPGLSLLLIHDANKSLALSGSESHSLEHAISLLGFPRCEKLIRACPNWDSKTFQYLDDYRQQLLVSQHAAVQCTAWAEHNAHWPSQEMYWPSLLFRAAHWVLWYRAGELMAELQRRRAQCQGAQHGQIEQKVLGVSLQQLSATMSKSWQLPTPAQQGWQPSVRGNARRWIMLSRIKSGQSQQAMENIPRLQRTVSSSGFAIALANRLAEESEWDWYSQRSLRLQKILASAQHCSWNQAITDSHRNAISASRYCTIEQSLTPARQLFSNYRKVDFIAVEPPAQPTKIELHAAPTSTAQTEKPGQAPALPLESLLALLKTPRQFSGLQQLLQLVVDSLQQQLAMERSAVWLYHRKQQQLRNYYHRGTVDSPLLANLRLQLQDGDLFSKFLAKATGLHLQEKNYPQIWPRLPGEFKQACGCEQFFLMSLFVNGRAFALLYCDRGISNGKLSNEEYASFKQLCRATSLAVEKLRSPDRQNG